VDHCRGGAGTDNFGASFGEDLPNPDAEHDMLTAIVDWVEAGRAPERLVATKMDNGIVKMTRPLCPYPTVSKYRGRGDSNDVASFVCVKP
jgi:feruloyl esterase